MPELFYGTRGPKDAPIVLVGEAWGQQEARAQRPFVGESGIELSRILAEAGIAESDILFTNVAAIHPFQNEMYRLFIPKEKKPDRIRGLAPGPQLLDEVRRLYQQIDAHPRKLVIAAGNYPLWAFSDVTGANVQRTKDNRLIPYELQTWAPSGIMDWRGSMWHCSPLPGFSLSSLPIPLLPIVHPAAILRQWSTRAVTVHDLRVRVPKALTNDWRPKTKPQYEIGSSYTTLIATLRRWTQRLEDGEGTRLAVDIETARSFITCLGIADGDFALSIPFIRIEKDRSFASHWPLDEELEIVRRLRRLLTHPLALIYGQNFIYDTQYIQHWLGCAPRLHHDTMLAQNVLFPGTPKDLGYLSSLYCDYHWYWKDDHKEWNLKGDMETLLNYNCEDCLRTLEIGRNQEHLIESLGQRDQMALKMKTHELCLRMMNRGVRIDMRRREQLKFELSQSLAGIHNELLQIVPQHMVDPDAKTLWFASPKQTQHLLYDQLAMRVVKNRKTGNPTVGKEALRQLRKWYPEFTGLLSRLDVAGSVENTVEVLNAQIDPDLRMRCSYNPGGTETHRLSSSTNAFGRGTNLQNLSKGEEDD